MYKIRKKWLGGALLSLSLIGCGGGDSTEDSASKGDAPLVVNSTFAATYQQTIEKPSSEHVAVSYSSLEQNNIQSQSQNLNTAISYDGILEVTNLLTKEKHKFDWPVTQKIDSDGNVETISHRSLTLKPGSYDFILLLTTKDVKLSQYMAKALGVDIIDGESPEVDFILLPNLGDTINDFEQISYVSTLKFSWPAEDLAGLNTPQFGLSINGNDEAVYSINKETGIAELIMNVEPGEYQLSMHLYDGDMMVGKTEEEDNTVNFVEGEDAKMDIIPLQADVNINLTPLKDQGTFTFTIPAEVINEVNSAEELALIVRLGGHNVPVQEKVLIVQEENGIYTASDLFETGGQKQVTAYLTFHNINDATEGYNTTPFASCNTDISTEQNQTLGCKLELKRESIITGRILGTLMLNVLDEDLQPALGIKVYVNDKLIGLTGDTYNTGSIKVNLTPGLHDIKAESSPLSASDKIDMNPLDVVNKVLYLKESPNIGKGHFVAQPEITITHGWSELGVLTDLDGDGDLDYVAPQRNRKEMILALNDGKGNFTVMDTAIALNHISEAVIAADIDGDGDNDLITLGKYTAGNAHQFFYNDGKGKFTAGQEIILGKDDGSASKKLAQFSDFDGDGDLDLVVKIDRSSAKVFKNDSKGLFSVLQYVIDTSTDKPFVISDINGDKYPDIVAKDNWINNGKGEFTKDGSVSLGANRGTLLSDDFNNDGSQDLFFYSETSYDHERHRLLLNNGAGNFTDATHSFNKPDNNETLALADVNGDGSTDIIMAANLKVNSSSVNQIHLYVNDGLADFGTPTLIDEKKSSEQLLTGDIDNDGDVDVISTWGGQMSIYLNQPQP
ncbi:MULTISPECIES: VCBS repeat-containing protein [unclassified Aliivibrio]|uniref:FG-GAP repeat domain-containing protein n=1 Tax=unclassified Aliivibrio TaxID=2645654 RepID=UPI00080DAD29|nr:MULTISPECIES: VCBS repeat-containing protein [unclassified Aliivibrio]OCH17376.1 hypothetical protein A6E05_13885 [Aliivibrio sp. 1S165]OCH23566.1 hypothetical protein A6E03_07910 [Aliivibrio sp. 1S128]OCH34370.1 hypothetical protein A6E06_00625 [Aliivibrio sp. 1S175]